MKKSIINLIICGTLCSVNYNAFAERNSGSDLSSKEWSSAPKNIKEALSNIQVMSGSSNKEMQSKNWLNELKRSPSTYNLTSNDVDWINHVTTGSPRHISNVNDTKVAKNSGVGNVNDTKNKVPKVSDHSEKSHIVNKKKEVKKEKEDVKSTTVTKQKSSKEKINKIAKHQPESKKTIQTNIVDQKLKDLNEKSRIFDQVENSEKVNHDLYFGYLQSLNRLNSLRMVNQEQNSYIDTNDGVQKLISMVKDNNIDVKKDLGEYDNLLQKSNNKKSISSINKAKESIDLSNDKKDIKLNNNIANNIVNNVNDKIKENIVHKKIIENELNGNSKSLKFDYKWKLKSFYIIGFFAIITLIFMSIIGFENNKRGKGE